MANASVGDAAAVLWAQVLRANATITALNLESNAISSGGVEALAEALACHPRSLKELKLANQRVTYSQRSEEALAEVRRYPSRARWPCSPARPEHDPQPRPP